ncbi:Hypothetical predicted protein [Mytilus galloprovincialis]|uniref:Uncharacterized protein n=1 Tax=Mytilus galloprovincialis TaxID=29158 RepID=A0A8B6HA38_MYTGA|nr:Hypothetical predicted protein [Mytilus galloprovincialis]
MTGYKTLTEDTMLIQRTRRLSDKGQDIDPCTQAAIVIEEMEDDVSQVKERMNNILYEFQLGQTDPVSDLSENE